MIRVWDPFVRIFHWAFALSFAVAWISAEGFERVHEAAGYAAGALALARIAWGFLGPGYARFTAFVRSPDAVAAYLKAMAEGAEARFIGHNPAGGAMIIALLVAMTATAATGWLLTTDWFWGSIAMKRVHSALAHGLLLLVLAHLAGVALASFRHRENLVRSMVFGDKRAAGPGDVA
jgi:cytochrome b